MGMEFNLLHLVDVKPIPRPLNGKFGVLAGELCTSLVSVWLDSELAWFPM